MFVTAKIQKKDGALENYDRTKLLLSMMRAQAKPDEAEQALTQIETWLTGLKSEFVTTEELHGKVAEVLKSNLKDNLFAIVSVGSIASGNYKKLWSDIDILVIVEKLDLQTKIKYCEYNK